MEILITGANGFLGQHLCLFLKDDHTVFATGKGEKRLPFEDVKYFSCDLANAHALREMMQQLKPEVIVHTAAMSKPDECLQQPDLCRQVNISSIGNLVKAVKGMDDEVHFIYTSSDFVLGDGGPHDENAIPAPLNFYGQTKLEGEQMLMNSGLQYTIVRPVFMYGEVWSGMRSTFLHWVKDSLEAGKAIKVVNDQMRTPSYTGDICKGIEAIINKKAKGLYHLAGEEVVSPYQMAIAVAELLNLNKALIEPVTADTFPEPVKRAKYGGLKIDKAKQDLGFTPMRLKEGLIRTFL